MQPLAGFFWIWGEVFRLCIGKAPPDQCCQPFLFTFLDGQPIHPWVSYGCSEHIYLVYKLKFPEAPKWSFQKLQNGASRSFKMKLPEAHPGSSKMELLRMFMLKIPGSSILNQKLQNEAASLSWEASIWSCQPSNGAASFKSKLPGWASGSLEAKNRAASSKTKLLGRLGMRRLRYQKAKDRVSDLPGSYWPATCPKRKTNLCWLSEAIAGSRNCGQGRGVVGAQAGEIGKKRSGWKKGTHPCRCLGRDPQKARHGHGGSDGRPEC